MSDKEENNCFNSYAKRLGVQVKKDRISFPKDMDSDICNLIIYHIYEVSKLKKKILELQNII